MLDGIDGTTGGERLLVASLAALSTGIQLSEDSDMAVDVEVHTDSIHPI